MCKFVLEKQTHEKRLIDRREKRHDQHAEALATGVDRKDPISNGTECDRTMMHDHQHRQANLQIVQIVLPPRSQRVERRETVAQT